MVEVTKNYDSAFDELAASWGPYALYEETCKKRLCTYLTDIKEEIKNSENN